MIAVGPPLALSTWSGRTGLSELPSLSGAIDWHAWERRVRLDIEALHAYAQAVHDATDTSLATLYRESPDAAVGEQPLYLLSGLLLTQAMWRGKMICLLSGASSGVVERPQHRF
jgi:hypothetical protein